MPFAALDDLERPFRAHGRSIPPRHREHIVDLCHMDQAREERNILSCQPVRIASSVPAFVVMTDRGHHVVKSGSDQNPFTDNRVFLVPHTVVSGRRARAVEPLVVELAHADIVEKASERRLFSPRRAELELPGHGKSETRHRFGVGNKIRVGA